MAMAFDPGAGGARRNVAFDAFICVDARSLEMARSCPCARGTFGRPAAEAVWDVSDP